MMDFPEEKSPTPVAADSGGHAQLDLPLNCITPKNVKRIYPDKASIRAVPLAVMLLGRFVSTPSMTYSHLKATRLPAYIGQLEELGWRGWICKSDLPSVLAPVTAKRRKPFARYCLVPEVVQLEGERGQAWALAVVNANNLVLSKYPLSDLWLNAGWSV